MKPKRLIAASLCLTLALILSACSRVFSKDEGHTNPDHETPGPSEEISPAPAEAGPGADSWDCPTNYFWGGLVTHSDEGYSYFIQYDQRSYTEQTINICRIADDGGKGEVVFSEPATWSDITSQDFNGRFVSYGALTAYKDRLYFLRSAEETELWWISTDGSASGRVTGWDGQTEAASYNTGSFNKTLRDGKYLVFPWGVSIDMEAGVSRTVFDPETDGMPVILGADGGFIYYFCCYENDDFSVPYRIAQEGGAPETVSAVTREFIKANDRFADMFTFVRNGTLWITCPDGERSLIETIDLESGEIAVISEAAAVPGLFSVTQEGIYWFEEDGTLWKCGHDGSGAAELTGLDSGKVFRKYAPMVSGDRIFYINGDDDYGLFCVKEGAVYFPFENVMGEDVENVAYWCNGPVW